MIELEIDDEIGLVSKKCGCILKRTTPKFLPPESWIYLHKCLKHS